MLMYSKNEGNLTYLYYSTANVFSKLNLFVKIKLLLAAISNTILIKRIDFAISQSLDRGTKINGNH